MPSHLKLKGSNSQAVLKKNKFGALTLPDLKIQCETQSSKQCRIGSKMEKMIIRTEQGPGIDPQTYRQLIFFFK